MNDLSRIFRSEGGAEVRCIVKDGEPWFVAVDVCRGIGIGNPTMALRALDEDEKGVSSTETLGDAPLSSIEGNRGVRTVAIVSEPGVYKLILRSRDATKPGTTAHTFCRWVTHDVIPSIRRTGSYSIPERLAQETLDLDNPAAWRRLSGEIRDAWMMRRGLKRARRTVQ